MYIILFYENYCWTVPDLFWAPLAKGEPVGLKFATGPYKKNQP